ncbi:YceI family protein [Winogradskyella aurantia]|uniref:Lipid/polyisoprenoid-binding YceI-like domain-containing protein n=1 Tax=Winogradskyella aurantia TaxID=1915063 RepID=A0A265UQN9_9FLAO|nr:YceI family protein [Winogradskyella aurantia]OZV67636.1 hypothetical protein CA834_11860 [Winogradskyella aurantia]
MINSTKFLALVLISIFSSILFSHVAFSQSYNLNNDTSLLEVHGTSSLHDWHVDAEKQMGKAEISTSNGMDIKTLNFSVASESLKSGKGSMDKNTYKALKTDSFKTIDFSLTSVKNVEKTSENSFKINAIGNMTICGVTKSIPIDFKIKSVGNQLLVEGEKPMLMTDYGIEPPKALFGTIKTGDEINVVFKAVYETKN